METEFWKEMRDAIQLQLLLLKIYRVLDAQKIAIFLFQDFTVQNKRQYFQTQFAQLTVQMVSEQGLKHVMTVIKLLMTAAPTTALAVVL